MQNSYGNGVFSIVKSVLLALGLSLLAAAVFAVVLRVASLPDRAIYPVNQLIKGISLAIGVLVFVRGEKGWLKGIAIAAIFTALSYLAFSALGGDFSLSWVILAELLGAALVGAVSGSLAVNLRR